MVRSVLTNLGAHCKYDGNSKHFGKVLSTFDCAFCQLYSIVNKE